jgi:hypothetical protein
VHHEPANLPKILKARVFVHIGEFHSAAKRATNLESKSIPAATAGFAIEV